MRSPRRFCAFCRTPRAVYAKKHIGPIDAFLAFAVSQLLGWVIFQDFDPRTLVFFALSVGLAESFIMFRWRLSVACPHCGFDPILYRKSPEKAALRVKVYMAERREDPMSAFTLAPKLPVLRKTKERQPPDAQR